MADQKISDLSEDSGSLTDHIAVAEGTSANKKVLLSAIKTLLGDLLADTTPQLGGQLDVNGNAIGDGTLKLLTFTEDASAVNHINIENEETGSGPILSAAGDDTNVDLHLHAKGTGEVHSISRVQISHTATATDDHTLELHTDAAAFGDVRSLEIEYTTGTIADGQEESVILVGIDESLATGGVVAGLNVLSTEGSATVYGLKVGAVIGPIHQSSGVFGDMDSALVKAVGSLTEFTTSDPAGANNVQIFVANSDTITIGDAEQFSQIEFLLEVVASGAGVKPTFRFSTGSGTWTAFTPTDGTDGFRFNGVVDWDISDIPTWAVGSGGEFLIEITRTQVGLSTVPTEDLVQIAKTEVYSWDKNGQLTLPAQEWDTQQNFNAATLTGLGADLVTDGDMSSNSNWTEGTGWTIGSGVASSDGTQSADADLTQNITITNGKTYQVTYTVSNYSAGNVTAVVGNTEGTDRSSNATFTENIIAGVTGDIDIRADLDFIGDIDNVIVKLANVSWDLNTQQIATLTLDGDLVLDNPTNMNDGSQCILRVLQDGTGSRLLTYGSVYKWPGGTAPTLSTGASERDKIGFDSNGTLMDGNFGADYS